MNQPTDPASSPPPPEPAADLSPPRPSAPPPPAAPPPGSPGGPPLSDATRYLCAAAYLDVKFRDRVIEELWENDHRALAPSFGIDVVPVLQHCMHARRHDVRYGWWLMGIFVAGLLPLFASVPVALLLLLLFGGASGAGGTGGMARGGLGTLRASGLGSKGVLLGGYLAVMIFLTVSWLPVWWFLANLAVLIASTTVVLLHTWHVGTVLRGNLAPAGSHAGPRVDISPLDAWVVENLGRQQDDEEIVYSRDEPFVGVGARHRAWKFATELVPDTHGEEPEDGGTGGGARAGGSADPDPAVPLLLSPDVNRAISASVAELAGSGPGAPGPYPRDRLRGITVRDRIMVPGFRADIEPPGDPADGPVSAAERAMLTSDEYVRHYLSIRVDAWEQEIVATVFVRCTTQGNLLYLEVSAFVMPPVNRAYHAVDHLLADEGPDLTEWLAEQMDLADTQFDHVRGAHTAAKASRRRRDRIAREVHRLAHVRGVDWGPVTSVRMLGSAPLDANLFQRLDAERYITSVEDRVLAGVREALKDAGLSTAAFDRTSREVNSQHITFSGGNFSGPMAFGASSKASQDGGGAAKKGG